ncbi:molybdopterin-synthase adenylyltransferase MoeB [Xanthomonas albilineans]|uniref:molybdopterin-synthase adenylyltransferase MoeB n=1 Tax=Xanthomonas albilineans TaxID=29447 RepID=UPI0005F32384|nr:molybdopterin-synthase adenylyltransferase MoeB [Xanthomonas albilineans]
MSIRELTPLQAHARVAQGARLIDIREEHEYASGMAEGALGVPRAQLQADPAAYIDMGNEILLICQSGRRSQETAAFLQQLGYSQVASVLGGTTGWQREGLPLQPPALPPEQQDFLERYARHLRLPEVGIEGQRRLQAARVLLVGAGGLGSPAGVYLAAAGVGHLRIADDDLVERSNLQRQILHSDARIGQPKVDSAATALAALNPGVQVEAVRERVTADNVERLLQEVDVVLDGSDNFPARYLLNDACVKLGKPLVYGAVQRFEGQVSVFDAGRQRGLVPCYRCLFPEPPPPEFAPNCAEAGVLGVLPGIVGLLQANEVLKLLLGIGEPLSGRLLHVDALAMRFRETRLAADPHCPLCAPGRPFPGYIDYARFCGASH